MEAIDVLLLGIEHEYPVKFSYPSSVDGRPQLRTFSPWEPRGESILGWDHTREAPRQYNPERVCGGAVVLADDEAYVFPD